MKAILIFLCLLVSCLGGSLRAAEPEIKTAKPQDGVFFTYTGYMTTVLELKKGHFRYWFETDVKMPKEPDYPLAGEFSVEGDTIILKHDQVFQKRLTFRSLDGAITLWRPDAMEGYKFDKYLEETKKYGGGAILVKTGLPADEIWKHRGPPSL